MPTSQIEILRHAERLASNLAGGHPAVEKNAFLSVVATFMSDPRPDLAKLRRTLQLLKKGSGGHIKRGRGYGEQIEAVAEELGRFLDQENFQPGDYKSLFGWTARLLLVQRDDQETVSEPRSSQDAKTFSKPGLPKKKEPAKTTASSNLGAVKQKGLGDLLKLKQQLEEKEKGGKK